MDASPLTKAPLATKKSQCYLVMKLFARRGLSSYIGYPDFFHGGFVLAKRIW